MPSVVIEVRCPYPEPVQAALLGAAYDAVVDALRVSPVHRNATLVEHPPHRFIGRTDCPDPDRLTNVTIYVMAGRSIEAKRRLHRLMVERLSTFGIPPVCVLIRLIELPPENFGVRGGQAGSDVDLGYPLDV